MTCSNNTGISNHKYSVEYSNEKTVVIRIFLIMEQERFFSFNIITDNFMENDIRFTINKINYLIFWKTPTN